MKARLPEGYGGGSMQKMIKQAQKAQEEMQRIQSEVEEMAFTATAGGDVVKAEVTGKKVISSIEISPEVVDHEDIEMLQDLVVAAVNAALAKVDQTMNDKLGEVTSGLNLPGVQ